MHRDHLGAVRCERGTQALRASADEKEEKKKKLEKRIDMLLYLYVHDDIYYCVLEIILCWLLYNRQIPMSSCACMMLSISCSG
jgi:hypothetical protein